ncbi:hypothetical protein WJR50_23920 [Catalinimonas sp. 4WD22]|uniref:hypothetical protein n=1 Tax=Catalinimonas locisalis TaxID=3133978 RepID=UPI0031016E8C
MFTDKMSEELQAYVAHADENDFIPVLVTTQEIVTNTAAFDSSGLKVSRNIASIPLLSGKIKASDIGKLLALEEVVKVELDSEITLDKA